MKVVNDTVEGHSRPPQFAEAKLIGIPKDPSRWDDPSAWRPISLPNAWRPIYEIVMHWIQSQVGDMWKDIVSYNQFGVKKRSAAMATHLLTAYTERMGEYSDDITVVLLDVRNAFGSLPHAQIFALLRLHGLPRQLVDLLQWVYREGWYHPSDGGAPFRTTCGIRQGCPVSVGLFVLGVDAWLQLFPHPLPIAYLDDIAFASADPEQALRALQHAELIGRRLNFQLNWGKTMLLTSSPRAERLALACAPDRRPKVQASGWHLGHPTTIDSVSNGGLDCR